ncbi:hypothetical protein [Nannocystis exedens]|uniref:hypothetical protein n=1 Tax=Nannocystis exedens TaxID=54 RepID=UPI001160C2AC|nr:hypothetical protein [Nannocystis exedens]
MRNDHDFRENRRETDDMAHVAVNTLSSGAHRRLQSHNRGKRLTGIARRGESGSKHLWPGKDGH